MKSILLTGCLLCAALVASCGDQNSSAAPEAGLKALGRSGGFSGQVIETTNTAGYTYVLVKTGAKSLWAAAPSFSVKVGDTAAITEGMPMPNYHSKTLNRDFDEVYFTDKVVVNGVQSAAGGKLTGLPKDHPPIGGEVAQLPKDHPPIGNDTAQLPKNHPPLGGTPTNAKQSFKGLKKAEGGKSIAELYSEKDKLGGQQIRVRGKVVKYNAMIMGKNWLHIQDGTGSQGSNDLVVTSQSGAKVGDTVLATGKLSTNKDLGAGYKFAVMLEEATLVVE